MLNVFFNPYPGKSTDYQSGKDCLLSSAKSYKKLSDSISLTPASGEEVDSIKSFALADKEGAIYTPSFFLYDYKGKERELVKWFLRMFDKGSRIKKENLNDYENWILTDLQVQAPILEYATKQDGVAVTISDNASWKLDFFSFIAQEHKLPNIHGEEDFKVLEEWIIEWYNRNLSFQDFLEKNFNIIFCSGATNTCFPSRYEEEGLKQSITKAESSGYNIDDDLIKNFKTKHGNILELRSYSDGVRLFFILREGKLVVGGFYRKAAAVSQGKSAAKAAQRLKDEGYLP